jgi:hypothetical protein
VALANTQIWNKNPLGEKGNPSSPSLKNKQIRRFNLENNNHFLGFLEQLPLQPPLNDHSFTKPRDLANPSSKLAIKRLVDLHHPSVILLQETMQGDKAINSLSPILLGWDFQQWMLSGALEV